MPHAERNPRGILFGRNLLGVPMVSFNEGVSFSPVPDVIDIALTGDLEFLERYQQFLEENPFTS